VKANAYGLGAVAVSRALDAVDPWGFGVATVAEAEELREGGIARPILVLLAARPEDFAALRAARATPVFDAAGPLGEWLDQGEAPFHLEIDTGMARGGIRWDQIERVAPLLDTPRFEGAFTQFHSSERGDGSVGVQLDRYLAALGRLPRAPRYRHVANSAAALLEPRCALDLVRPGVFLYGGSPGGKVSSGRPVASIRARVAGVRRARSGETAGYNARWSARRDTTLATLAIGYADGVPTELGPAGPGWVLLRGTRCPVVGSVSMDLTIVDAGDTLVVPGDIATLLGAAEGDAITLDEWSQVSGIQPRRLLTGLGRRLPRIYE
jgi:alanine racemase